MHALLVRQPGNLKDLKWEETDDLEPGSGQLLVRVKATSLNPADYKRALREKPADAYPFIVGLDVASEVIAAGSGTEGFQPGDRVAVLTSFSDNGGFAEQALVDARAAAPIPNDVSDEEAAAILCAGMTAYEAIIQKLNTDNKQTILIHAGSGGVGGFAIQLAKQKNLTVLTTASSYNHDWVRKLGADVAIDYKSEDVTARVLSETKGLGVDLIVNPVNSETATEDLNRLAFSGQLAYIAGGPDLSAIKPFTLAPSIHEVALAAAYGSNHEAAIRNLAYMAGELMQMIADQTLDPMVTKVLPREEIVSGLRKLKDQDGHGKIAVRMF